MAKYTEKKIPYEFLVRFDNDGKLKGAHIGFVEKVFKDKTEISTTITNVMPVSFSNEEGFPIKDILNDLQFNTIVENEFLQSQNKILLLEIEDLKQELQTKNKENV